MSDFIKRPQIEVLSAADCERRRHWSDVDKLSILEEIFRPPSGDSHGAAAWHLPVASDHLAAAVSKWRAWAFWRGVVRAGVCAEESFPVVGKSDQCQSTSGLSG